MSIAPPSMATGVAIEESEMSRKGQPFIAADQGRIENQGQQSIHITTNEGRGGLTRVQIGDVNRPLMAVSQMCDAGNYVLFTSEGGSVLNLHDGQWTDFERLNNVYSMDWWLTTNDANGETQKTSRQNETAYSSLQSFKDIVKGASGFTRQGR